LNNFSGPHAGPLWWFNRRKKTMAAQTFAYIANIANALPRRRHEDLADRVQYMIVCAWENAHDTIHVDKAATEADFDDLAMASLESNLCFCEDYEVCNWFAENDIAY
jgi:hypothetical protein